MKNTTERNACAMSLKSLYLDSNDGSFEAIIAYNVLIIIRELLKI